HFMRAQWPFRRVEQFIPSRLWRRNTKRLGYELVPCIQIVTACSADRSRQGMQQHKRARRLPSSEIARCAAAPQMRCEATARISNISRHFNDHFRFYAAFLLGELRGESRV